MTQQSTGLSATARTGLPRFARNGGVDVPYQVARLGPPTVIARSVATRQSMGAEVTARTGLPRFARNDGVDVQYQVARSGPPAVIARSVATRQSMALAGVPVGQLCSLPVIWATSLP